jgi:pullulanase
LADGRAVAGDLPISFLEPIFLAASGPDLPQNCSPMHREERPRRTLCLLHGDFRRGSSVVERGRKGIMSTAEVTSTSTAVSAAAAKPLALRRQTAFVLWAPEGQTAPTLVIGRYDSDGRFDLAASTTFALRPREAGLWEISAKECALEDGVYGYWFQVKDNDSAGGGSILITDPVAFAVDRANPAPPPRSNDGRTVGAPAAVVRVRSGRLEPSDPVAVDLPAEPAGYRQTMAPNNQMVIYELPTRWVKAGQGVVTSGDQVGVGTFFDVLALISPDDDSPHFAGSLALANREHLVELGVNAIELLPPADSPQSLEWGYGTANYFSADFDLGHQEGALRSAATLGLRRLIAACHRQGMRFIQDVVMGFAVDQPYDWISPDIFLGDSTMFGGRFWSYHGRQTTAFDPVSGNETEMQAARRYMLACVAHWLTFFHIDGARLDYVEGINDWFFIREYSAHARAQWKALGGTDDRFWVVGEELGQSAQFASSGTADASWDETFKRYVRQLCIGTVPDGRDLGSAVSFMIDCRQRGFADGAMAVNYIGSHDLTNDAFSDRFYSWLDGRGVIFKERNIKLAFTCLLTAVGVPMILAGDEFADERDIAIAEPTGRNKQIDPVNYDRFSDPWRQEMFAFVSRLVKLRARSVALGRNDCSIIHIDTTDGRRIAVWQRGAGDDLVVVVANFSDFISAGGLTGEYVIPAWPNLGARPWFEVSQTASPRIAPNAGREPLFPWEAKVYATRP